MKSILLERVRAEAERLKSEGYSGPIIVNSLKEYLQYIVLNFLYNNPKYSYFVIYGGTVLRICYGLDRMSEDLDFQVEDPVNLDELKNDLLNYFKNDYGLEESELFISVKHRDDNDTDMVKISFADALKDLNIGINWTGLKLKIDINKFPANNFKQEIVPIIRGDINFSIRTYPLTTLMGSKLAAVFLRRERYKGNERSDYKGRDIYDTLWYLGKGIVPDLEYIRTKGIDVKSLIELFENLENRINKIEEKALKEDLTPLFYNSFQLESWFGGWRNSFSRLISQYNAFEVGEVSEVNLIQEPSTLTFTLQYVYKTRDGGELLILVKLSPHYFNFNDFNIDGFKDRIPADIVNIDPGQMYERMRNKDIVYEYAGLFYEKIEKYLNSTERKVIAKEHYLQTRFLTPTSERPDPSKRVFLDKKLLLNTKFKDLL